CSGGPRPDVVALSDWVAHRWAGPRVAVLRSASPPNIVPPTVGMASAAPATRRVETVVRWPPLADRRELVASMCAGDGSTIVCVARAGRSRAPAACPRHPHPDSPLLH